MEYSSAVDIIIKLVALFSSVYVLFKKINDASTDKATVRRTTYEFSEKFLADDKWIKMSDYLLEKGYLAISGKQLKAAEIRFLFNTHNPSSKFQLFEKAERYLTIAEENNIRTLTYKNEYTKKRIRRMMINKSCGYFITAILSATPLFFMGDIIKTFGINGLWTSLLWSVPFGFIAYTYVREYGNLCSAEYIVNQSWREKRPEES